MNEARLEHTTNCNLEEVEKILVQVVEEIGFLDLDSELYS